MNSATTTSKSEALQTVISALGLSSDDVLALLQGADPPPMPTLGEFISVVEEATSPAAARTYSTYWRRLVEALGERTLDGVKTSDLEKLLNNMETVKRRSGKNGYQARRSAVQAWRKVWSVAENDGLITRAQNPASRLKMPPRQPVSRRGLSDGEIQAVFDVLASTGNDPDLDCLLFRFHLETGARRGGAISLTVDKVDIERQTVLLEEKGSKWREMPITLELMKQMLEHADERGGGVGPLFRYKNGNPLTRRRYNYMFERVHENPPFSAAAEISPHWLRHSAISKIERVSSESVASRFAGHQPHRSSVTGLYTTAAVGEMVDAWCTVWGVSHPLTTS